MSALLITGLSLIDDHTHFYSWAIDGLWSYLRIDIK